MRSRTDQVGKEFVFFTDTDVEELSFGALPAVGRYFSKPCTPVTPGVFRVEVEAPPGDLYYHCFLPGKPGNVILDVQNLQVGAKNWHSICRLGTANTAPVRWGVTRDDHHNAELKVMCSLSGLSSVDILLHDRSGKLTRERLERGYASADHSLWRCRLDLRTVACFAIVVSEPDRTYYATGSGRLGRHADWITLGELENVDPPTLADGAVYHVFPDRFRRSPSVPGDRELTAWGTPPTAETFFGGNLAGIVESLGHLDDLGVRYLYLTPIFAADSPHRYDSYDFERIDPLLGDESAFRHLVGQAHRRGIKVVLDIVLNHCGTAFWAFADVVRHQHRSRYRSWFLIDDFPLVVEDFAPGYRCWWNNGRMPEFNLDNPEVRRYLINACVHWVEEFEVDGWRIDVSSELPPDFLREVRDRLNEAKPDTVFIGENWKDASAFLSGDAVLSGVTNYRYWWEMLVPLLAERTIGVERFARRLAEIVFQYPHNRLLSSWNVLSSHDIPRFSHLCRSRNRLKIAIALQVFLPGVPVVYYGDEIGLAGGDDPDNRRCMSWDQYTWDLDLLEWHRGLLRTRARSLALQRGRIAVDSADDATGVLVLRRQHGRERALLAINLGKHPRQVAGFGVVHPAEVVLVEEED